MVHTCMLDVPWPALLMFLNSLLIIVVAGNFIIAQHDCLQNRFTKLAKQGCYR